MEVKDAPAGPPGMFEYSVMGGNGRHFIMLNPPPSSNAPHNSSGEENDRKRRRVEVDLDKPRIAALRLGSEVVLDFNSNHADAEQHLADIMHERNSFLRRLKEEVETFQFRITLERDYHNTELAGLTSKLRGAEKAHTKTKNELKCLDERTQSEIHRMELDLRAALYDLMESQAMTPSPAMRQDTREAALVAELDRIKIDLAIAKMDAENSKKEVEKLKKQLLNAQTQNKSAASFLENIRF